MQKKTDVMRSVTFTFVGRDADKLAETLFVHWLDGGFDQTFEGHLIDQGLATGIEYEWDQESRTIRIRAS